MKLSDVKVGDVLIARGDFYCLQPDQKCKVKSDAGHLYVTCARRRHYLGGQKDDDGNLIGFEPCS